ncbi:MAG TPA: amidase [Kofleriaceae bacterium]|nr:amidase [Kofleriaceae bacterium]
MRFDRLDRRQFLGCTTAAGAALLLAPLGCAGPGAGGAAAQPPAGPGSPPPRPATGPQPAPHAWIEEATIAGLQAAMKSGEHSSRAITEAYLARIEALDRRGPALHSVIELNPDALADADRLDQERRGRGPRGPLHGIPILLKDNIATADRMTTTAGSLALAGSIAPRDSAVAARLRAAGAVLLGKANMSEWANFRSTRSVSGWSGRGGQCRNPYDLSRSPCGSSSGSAAAVAANLCAVAIGSETDGSIVCPSASCGIVGIKPTVGLVSRAGVIPISHTQDTAGPMCRTVADAAAVLAVLAGADERDPATRGIAPADYTTFDVTRVRGARIGVARTYFGYHPGLDARIEESIAALRSLGAEIIDPVALGAMKELEEAELDVLLYEFKADLDAYLADLGPSAPVHSLADVIAFNEKHSAEEMPIFGQELFIKAQAKGPLTDGAYRKALARCRRVARTEGIDAIMKSRRLDALVAPTNSPAWLVDRVLGDHFVGGSSTPAAVAGYPSVTVPAGHVDGLPVGISLFGRRLEEQRLVGLAHALEQATHVRRPPTMSEMASEHAPDAGAGCPCGH